MSLEIKCVLSEVLTWHTIGIPGSAVQSNSGNSTGTAGVNAWVQSAIAVAKGNNSAEGATANAAGSGAAQSAPLPLTVSTATFPGIPAVRLIGDCQFLHRLCQLLFFCVIFRKRQLPRFVAGPRMAAADSASAAKSVGGVPPKTEETSSTSGMTRSSSGVTNVKTEDGTRGPQSSSKSEEPPNPRSARVGSGNAGQGYTSEEVIYVLSHIRQSCPAALCSRFLQAWIFSAICRQSSVVTSFV